MAEACAVKFKALTEIGRVCADYTAAIEGLLEESAKFTATAVGIALGIGGSATLLWAILAWIGRGFMQRL